MPDAKPWESPVVVMDKIPVTCPACHAQVGVRGGVDLEREIFTVERCPRCGAKLEMHITSSDAPPGADEQAEPSPLSALEITIRVTGLRVVQDAFYKLGNIESLEELLCRSVNIICTIVGGEELPPATIKDMYIRSELSSFYMTEGKEELVAYLKSLIAMERANGEAQGADECEGIGSPDS